MFKRLAVMTAALVALASAAHAQDLKSLSAQFQGDADDADRQMTYAENNAGARDDYSACLNVRNAINDYEDAIQALQDMAAIIAARTDISDDQRKEFTDTNTEAQVDFTDRLDTAKRSAGHVCYGN